jgi:hypothetical protein
VNTKAQRQRPSTESSPEEDRSSTAEEHSSFASVCSDSKQTRNVYGGRKHRGGGEEWLRKLLPKKLTQSSPRTSLVEILETLLQSMKKARLAREQSSRVQRQSTESSPDEDRSTRSVLSTSKGHSVCPFRNSRCREFALVFGNYPRLLSAPAKTDSKPIHGGRRRDPPPSASVVLRFRPLSLRDETFAHSRENGLKV